MRRWRRRVGQQWGDVARPTPWVLFPQSLQEQKKERPGLGEQGRALGKAGRTLG